MDSLCSHETSELGQSQPSPWSLPPVREWILFALMNPVKWDSHNLRLGLYLL
jgi:hypothetical protein